jgi:hypothetical protein
MRQHVLVYETAESISSQRPECSAGPQRADEAFGDRVCPRRPDGCADDGDVGGGEDRVEGGAELDVPIADHVPELLGALAKVHQQVASLLGHPCAGGMGGDPGEVHAAAAVDRVGDLTLGHRTSSSMSLNDELRPSSVSRLRSQLKIR